MQAVVIESEAMRVGVLPDYGARVVSLIDKATGRDWMFGGPQSPRTSEDAMYGADEAVGWDECFPTVSPCDASGTTWGRRLRDHGDLWGRPWTVDAQSAASLTTHYSNGEFAFSRKLALLGASLTASYRVENHTALPMPYLWALHGLLAVLPGETISLPGITQLDATYISQRGVRLNLPTISWPGGQELGFRPGEVQPETAAFAGKFYVTGCEAPAAVGRRDRWLAIRWSGEIDTLGVWLNYGGWPSPPRGHHLAIEPTTAAADDLAAALDAGVAAWVAPGESTNWTITLTLAGDVA